jgi:type VI secretion system protein ImpH
LRNGLPALGSDPMSEPLQQSPGLPIVVRQDGFRAFWNKLVDAPFGFDLFFVLRTIQAHHADLPRLGTALRPRSEPIRMGQDPSLNFAPATIAKVLPARSGQPERITIWSFGLYGPNGPMPTHLTEYVRDRLYHHGDETLARFSDVFHHRLMLLFFRAWSDAQPTVSLDRPGNDTFGRHLGSLIGVGEASSRERDQVPDHAKWFMAGHLTRQTRNPEGLQRALQIYFECEVRIKEFCLHYLELEPDQQTRLTRFPSNSQLGVDTVLGDRVPDAQSKFHVRVGPVRLAQFKQFLPGQLNFVALVDWIRNYLGIEYAWDVRLVLHKDDIPAASLGGSTQLGWTSWMLDRPAQSDADDLGFDPERWLKQHGHVVRGSRRTRRADSRQ